MNTTNPRSEFSRPSIDEIHLLIRRAHVERSRYLASLLRQAAIAARRSSRHVMRRLTASTRPHDLSGRPA
jgi:hypothetical protein